MGVKKNSYMKHQQIVSMSLFVLLCWREQGVTRLRDYDLVLLNKTSILQYE